jgi:hypothetical protein
MKERIGQHQARRCKRSGVKEISSRRHSINQPFCNQPFANHSTTPTSMMTLDGTFWVEDGVPYMVFCNEWVQVSDGTIEYMLLKDDLSDAAGPPVRMFRGSEAK